MANDKKFVVKNGLQSQNIDFVSPNESNKITITMLDSDTLSVSGNSGQLFSITDTNTGTIFAVNDISGVPSIEVDDDGEIRLAPTFGNVLIGTSTDSGLAKLQISGNLQVTGRFYDSSSASGESGYVLRSTNTGTQWAAVSSVVSSATPTVLGTVYAYTPSSGGNISLGYNSGNTTQTGANNIVFGAEAFLANTTSANNVAIGYQAGYCNTTGTGNTFIGLCAGRANSA